MKTCLVGLLLAGVMAFPAISQAHVQSIYPSPLTLAAIAEYQRHKHQIANMPIRDLAAVFPPEDQPPEAVIMANRALQANPSDVLAHLLLADIWLESASTDKSVRGVDREDFPMNGRIIPGTRRLAGYALKHYQAILALPPLPQAWIAAHKNDAWAKGIALPTGRPFLAGLDDVQATVQGLLDGTLPRVLTDQEFYQHIGEQEPHPSASTPMAATGVLLDVSGSGQKKTKIFTVTGDATIEYTWDCGDGPAILQIIRYNSKGEPVDFDANTIKPRGSDTTYIHERGTFYLNMNTTCNWHVIVSQ
jgi:hypothetical protein